MLLVLCVCKGYAITSVAAAVTAPITREFPEPSIHNALLILSFDFLLNDIHEHLLFTHMTARMASYNIVFGKKPLKLLLQAPIK